MNQLKILNSREIKLVKEAVKNQFGCEIVEDLVFLKNQKDRVFITNKDIAKLDLDRLKINSIGLYFGEYKHEKLRLSIEGAQFVGKSAKKNIVILKEEDAARWMKGNDISLQKKSLTLGGFVILKHGDDILGCGKYNGEKILNYVPKERRV